MTTSCLYKNSYSLFLILHDEIFWVCFWILCKKVHCEKNHYFRWANFKKTGGMIFFLFTFFIFTWWIYLSDIYIFCVIKCIGNNCDIFWFTFLKKVQKKRICVRFEPEPGTLTCKVWGLSHYAMTLFYSM